MYRSRLNNFIIYYSNVLSQLTQFLSLLLCSSKWAVYFVGLNGFRLFIWNQFWAREIFDWINWNFCWFPFFLLYGMESDAYRCCLVLEAALWSEWLWYIIDPCNSSKFDYDCMFVTKCEASLAHWNRRARVLVDLLRQILFCFQFIDQITHVKLPITVNSHQRSGSDKLSKSYRTVWKV